MAAAYAKTILLKIPGQEVHGMEPMARTLLPMLNNSQLRDAISEWLSPVDFLKRRRDILNDYVAGTAEWFFETHPFLAWYNGTGPKTLYVEGINGAGKSMLASLAAEHLLNMQSPLPRKRSVTLSVFYDYRTPDKQSCADLIGGMLRQVLFITRTIPIHPEIRELYDEFRRGGTRPSTDALSRCLLTVLEQFRTVFIIIDALDECAPSKNHELQALRGEWKAGASSGFFIHMLTVPRFLYARLKADSIRLMTNRSELDESLTDDDTTLDHVYQSSLKRINNLGSESLLLMAQNLIVWAVLSSRPLSISEIGHALAVNPRTRLFNKNDVPEVTAILSLTQGLIVHQSEAKGLRPVHETAYGVLLDYVNSIERFGLGGPHHYAADMCAAYLCLDGLRDGAYQIRSQRNQWLQSSPFYDYAARNWAYHAGKSPVLGREVIAFLDCQEKVEASWEEIRKLDEAPNSSLILAGQYPAHVHGLHLAVDFKLEHATDILLDLGHEVDSRDTWDRTPLMAAVIRGHEGIIERLLQEGPDVNALDATGRSPLSYAIMNGNERIWHRLLAEGASAASDTFDYQAPLEMALDAWVNPLWDAAINGHNHVVKRLLSSGARFEAQVDDDEISNNIDYFEVSSPLWHIRTYYRDHAQEPKKILGAARHALEAQNSVFRAHASGAISDVYRTPDELGDSHLAIYLAQDESVNKMLLTASSHGSTAAVQQLLDGGADLEVASLDRRLTPLHLAASNNHAELVHLLLENDADVTVLCKNGLTPLLLAASRGCTEVAHLLLLYGANPTDTDNSGRTPLHLACEHGHTEVVQILLENGSDVTTVDGKGSTPLKVAAERQDYVMISVLLERFVEMYGKRQERT
ncbi:hypothetical protein ACJ41O_012615 [Fusarium nematophilum]